MRFSTLLLTASSVALSFTTPIEKRASVFQWFGVNESGAEFGSRNLPGVKGTDYTWPINSTIDVCCSSIPKTHQPPACEDLMRYFTKTPLDSH